MKTRTLQLITQYDAHRNQYTVFHHNLTPEQANEELRKLSARLLALFVVDQHGVHPEEDPDECEACRREVERTAHVQPKPTQQRRKS